MNEAERTREELLKELETQREDLAALEATGSAAKAAEEQFRGLLDAAPDAMIIVNQDGQIVLINRQTETLFGYARDEIIDQAVERLVPERFRNQHPIYRTAYVATPSFRPMGAGIELYGLHKDGSEGAMHRAGQALVLAALSCR